MNKFDELAKSLVRPVPRRGGLKTFGAGLALGCATLLLITNSTTAAERFLKVKGDFHVSRGTGDSFAANYRIDTTEALDFLEDVIARVNAGQL